jgi:hypothetical protein
MVNNLTKPFRVRDRRQLVPLSVDALQRYGMQAFDQFQRTAGIGLLETTIELLAGEGAQV